MLCIDCKRVKVGADPQLQRQYGSLEASLLEA
jgi:hypothetical protein